MTEPESKRVRLTKSAMKAAVIASVVVLVTEGRYLLMEPGEVVGFAQGGIAALVSMLVVAICSFYAFFQGFRQLNEASARDAIICFICGLAPMGLLHAISWYAMNVKGIVFD